MVGLTVMKQYINPLLRVFSVVTLIGVVYFQNREIQKYKTIQNVSVDSLQTELFILQTEIQRYEIATEILKEQDSAAATKLGYILTYETE